MITVACTDAKEDVAALARMVALILVLAPVQVLAKEDVLVHVLLAVQADVVDIIPLI